jgi:hypothetical protein
MRHARLVEETSSFSRCEQESYSRFAWLHLSAPGRGVSRGDDDDDQQRPLWAEPAAAGDGGSWLKLGAAAPDPQALSLRM